MKIQFVSKSPAKVYPVLLTEVARPLATVTRGYSGVYESEIDEADVASFLNDLEATKLQTPNAFINFIWLIKNVTRAFTHQLVRYRVGTSFVQESLRFSEKSDCIIYMPAAIAEAEDQRIQSAFRYGATQAFRGYETAIGHGAAVQDARGLLPTNVCTHIFFACNLQTLAHIYEQRACCQAQQDEWQTVLAQMKSILKEQVQMAARFLKAPWENPNCVTCGFGASFDRPCTRQERFDYNLRTLANRRLGIPEPVNMRSFDDDVEDC